MNAENSDIKVEDVMIQIKENIKKRRKENLDGDNIISTGQCQPVDIPENVKQDIDYINSNWDLRYTEYNISSHRPIIGRLLTFGRRLVHGEVRRYMDLIIGKQSEFNASVVRISNSLMERIDSKIDVINRDIDSKIDTKGSCNRDIYSKVDTKGSCNRDIDSKVDTRGLYNNNKMNYFLFEEKYRGSTEDIKQRQLVFLEYFKNCKNVLDVGCGRGEFMSLLNENGIGIKGVDINEDMVLFCKKNDLDVTEIDALAYLDSLKDKSLDGIFSGQVVEHLQPNELINLLKLCYDKMIYGSYFVAETINPTCLGTFSTNFYMDFSHVKPVHPETFKFLLESIGFRDIQFKFLSPFPDGAKLKNVDLENVPEESKKEFEILNQNINKLNDFIFGFRDYAIIGKK